MIGTLIRFFLFLSFAVFSAGTVTSVFCNIAYPAAAVLTVFCLITISITLRHTLWAVLGIPLCLPAISALQEAAGTDQLPLLSLMFAVFYLSWFIKQLYLKNNFSSPAKLGLLIDLMAATTVVSMFSTIMSVPADLTFHQFFFGSFPRQLNPLFTFENTWILLSGLFYFRIIEQEITSVSKWEKALIIPTGQSIIIIFLYLLQPVLLKSSLLTPDRWSPYFPLADIHSFGSCLLLLLFTLSGAPLGKRLKTVLISCLALLIFITGSKVSLVALLIVGSTFLFFHLPGRSKIHVLILALSLILITGTLTYTFKTKFTDDNNRFITRYSQVFSPVKLYHSPSIQARLLLWKRALKMIQDSPITGTGIGTFHSLSQNYQKKSTPKRLFNNQYSPQEIEELGILALNENAHNYYLQLTAELGILTLCLWLSVILFCLYNGIRFIHSNPDQKQFHFISGLSFGIIAYLLTMLTGHPLLLFEQQLFFWYYLAILPLPCYLETVHNRQSRNGRSWIGPALIILLILYTWAALKPPLFPGNKFINRLGYGFYKLEHQKDPNNNFIVWRWSMQKAQKILFLNSDILHFRLSADTSNSQLPEGLEVKIFANNQLLDLRHFIDGGTKTLTYYVPNQKNRNLKLRLECSRTFNPYQLGINDDHRDLGVMLMGYKFHLDEMPDDGIGFYAEEKWPQKDLPEDFMENSSSVRWTGMRASFPVSETIKKSEAELYFKVAHPDIQQKNVTLTVKADNRAIKTVNFSDYSWKKLVLSSNELENSEVLTFILDRTWNPKLTGLAEDTRDLGVAVLIPEVLRDEG